jgi:hypothetical protein
MVSEVLSRWLRWWGGIPCFRIYGKARVERDWHVIDVYANHCRDASSRWPLWRGTCITWTAQVMVVGWDFAEELLREQESAPAARVCPVEVAGRRIRDLCRRAAAGAAVFASASEILAHECGHTWQVRQLGAAYLPLVGAVTLFGEGSHFWNHFENQASGLGQFGGLVNGSVCHELLSRVTRK